MKKLFATLGVVGGALSGTFVSTPAQASTITQALYRVSPWLAPHKTWDLPGVCPGIDNGASVALYNYDAYNCNYPAVDQKWYIVQAGTNGSDGTAYANQPYYNILQGSSSSSECLDVPGGSNGYTNGNELDTWSCNGGAWQEWYFTQEETGSGTYAYNGYKITNRGDTALVIDLAGCTTENGTHVQLWGDGQGACDNSNGQRWVLTRADQDLPVMDYGDDFTSINGNNWNLENDGPGAYNSELEAYNPSQISSDGEHAILTAQYVSGKTANTSGAYVSGRMNGAGKQYYQNGAWSAQLRYTQDHAAHYGAWPAFWLVGEGTTTGTCWPDQGSREIDIWEWMFVDAWNDAGQPSSYGFDGNAIYGSGCGITDMLTNHVGNPDATFNPNDVAIVKMIFDENVGTGGPLISYYVNGVYQTSWGMDAFYNQPYYPIINLAIGGGPLAGQADASGFNSTSDWAKVTVDWVAHESWCTASSMAAGNCTPGTVTPAPVTCTPITTCPSGDNCGTISNGCGGTVTCGGSCTAYLQTCGGGGTANVCGSSDTPYGGTAWTIPGTVQAENYDVGGEGVAYHDNEPQNLGGQDRTDGVDIEDTGDTGGGYDVGWMIPGEWMNYTVNVGTAGTYQITLRTASDNSGSSTVSLDLDGNSLTGNLTVPATGGWQTWENVVSGLVTLPAGQHVLTFNTVSVGQNLNYMTFALQIPAASWSSTGGGLQTQSCSEGGLNVDNVGNNDWASYNDIDLTGITQFSARVASGNYPGTVSFYVGSTTGTLLATCSEPVTGGWQNWTTVTCPVTTTATGNQTLYAVFNGQGVGSQNPNVEWIQLE